MMSLIKKIKERGVLHLSEMIFNRVVPAWIFRFSIGHILELDPKKLSEVLPQLNNSEFVLKCVGQESPAREVLRKVTWNNVPLESTVNDFGYAITKNTDADSLLGGVWGGVESFRESDLGFQIQFTSDQSWIYCAYVDKSARGQGVYKRVLSFAANDLTQKGYKRIMVAVQPWNKASMCIHKKYALKKLGTVMGIRVFSLCCIFVSGAIVKDKALTTKPATNPVQITIK